MKLASIDLEMNQPSGKIIQIGIVCFRPSNGQILETFTTNVDPKEPISSMITDLTGVDDGCVNGAPDIVEAASLVTEFKHQNQVSPLGVVWGSWGSNDVSLIYEQSGVCTPFNRRVVDVKAAFQMYASVAGGGVKVKTGLRKACQYLEIGWDNTHGEAHGALADAHNTVRVYLFLARAMKSAIDVKNSSWL